MTAEILSNNFPCISSFPWVRLKFVAMAYIRVIPNTIELLFFTVYLSCPSLSVPLVFHKLAFLLICLVSVLLSVKFTIVKNYQLPLNHGCHCQQIGKNIFFSEPYCLEPFCPRGMVMNSRTIWFKGRNGPVQH